VSGPGQAAEDRDGPVRQQKAIAEYCEKNGLKVLELYIDKISGTNELGDRPQMMRMMEDIRLGEVRHVVIERLDRLARDLMVQETIIGQAGKYNTTILSTHEPDLCSTDPSRVFVRQIFGAVAQYERGMLVAKLQAARARTGRLGGYPAYGHYEGEQELIGVICLRFLEGGQRPHHIARWLNENGKRMRKGTLWTPIQVVRILEKAGLYEQNWKIREGMRGGVQ
jgi:DNA invertase Pin-like site-specific DNA recombinase